MNLAITLAAFILLPTLFYLVAIIYSKTNKEVKAASMAEWGQMISLSSILISISALGFVITKESFQSEVLLYKELGISFHFDEVSLIMLSMISIISWVILKYSKNYLSGDPRQALFFARLMGVIASVQLLVLAGNLFLLVLAWIATSFSLHYLLIFYKDRPRAIIAARKKFIVARVADGCLLAAAVLLYLDFNTGELNSIFSQVQNGATTNLEIPAVLIAIAAIFKSAQLPFHSWLLEVMETPTPVSALLHAGLLNAGPFLLVRLSYLVNESLWAPVLLISIGGLTALFASIVYTTQNSVKTALAYSSMGHMGFSLMSCGLGVYSAAMLHLVAHSFYKAHAFLSSGSVIDKLNESQYKLSQKVGSPVKILLGILLAASLYAITAYLWNVKVLEQLPLFALGFIITMGSAHMIIAMISRKNALSLVMAAIGLAFLVNVSFFTLEGWMHQLLENATPTIGSLNGLSLIVTAGVLAVFLTVFIIQANAPFMKNTEAYQRLHIHMRNGLYLNTWFDKLVKAHQIKSKATSTLEYIEMSEVKGHTSHKQEYTKTDNLISIK